MNKEELIEILTDWNFWKKDLDTGIERTSYLEKCLKFLKTDVVATIIGIRRSGKSYLMKQVIKKLIENKIDRKNILMVNFEDKRFTEFSLKLLDQIYETYLEYLKPDKEHYIFLDEIHNIPKWEKWVRTMHELKKAKIIISGSSSKLLSDELGTILTGRHLDITAFPLNFKEVLNFKNLEIKDKLDLLSKKTEIKRRLSEYMEYGGFPEVVLSDSKKELLLTYFDDILTKDIEKRYNLNKGEKLRALARFYLTNLSNPITFNSISKFIETTTATIEKFSSYLEEVNLIFFIKRFSFGVKEQEKAARKVYGMDVGLANAIGFRFSADIGRVAENLVAIELKKTESVNREVYYWQDIYKNEVDFAIKEGLKVKQLIEVCWDISEYKIKEKKVKNLIKASRELKCNNLFIITGDYENEEKINNKRIRYIPLWKWLLGNK